MVIRTIDISTVVSNCLVVEKNSFLFSLGFPNRFSILKKFYATWCKFPALFEGFKMECCRHSISQRTLQKWDGNWPFLLFKLFFKFLHLPPIRLKITVMFFLIYQRMVWQRIVFCRIFLSVKPLLLKERHQKKNWTSPIFYLFWWMPSLSFEFGDKVLSTDRLFSLSRLYRRVAKIFRTSSHKTLK